MLSIMAMTTKELSRLMARALDRAKREVGGNTGLAKALSEYSPERPITPQAVSQWDVTPPARVLDVEAVTGVSRCDLRPDFYPKKKARAVA